MVFFVIFSDARFSFFLVTSECSDFGRSDAAVVRCHDSSTLKHTSFHAAQADTAGLSWLLLLLLLLTRCVVVRERTSLVPLVLSNSIKSVRMTYLEHI